MITQVDWLNRLVNGSDDDDDDELVPIETHSVAVSSQFATARHIDQSNNNNQHNVNTGDENLKSPNSYKEPNTAPDIILNIPIKSVPSPSATISPQPSTSKESSLVSARQLPNVTMRTHNVVAAAQIPCHVDLKLYMNSTVNVVMSDARTMVEKYLRHPRALVKIFANGKITVIGARTPQHAYIALRRTARTVQKALRAGGHVYADKIRLLNFKVYNVMSTTKMPFTIDLEALAQATSMPYEPELGVGLSWAIVLSEDGQETTITLRVHHTGSIIITGARSCLLARRAIEHAIPTLMDCRSDASPHLPNISGPLNRVYYRKMPPINFINKMTPHCSKLEQRHYLKHFSARPHSKIYALDEDQANSEDEINWEDDSDDDREATDDLSSIDNSRREYRLRKEENMFNEDYVDVQRKLVATKPMLMPEISTGIKRPARSINDERPTKTIKFTPKLEEVKRVDVHHDESDDDDDFEDV